MSDDERFLEFRVDSAGANPWGHPHDSLKSPWDRDSLNASPPPSVSPMRPPTTHQRRRSTDALSYPDDGDLASMGLGSGAWRETRALPVETGTGTYGLEPALSFGSSNPFADHRRIALEENIADPFMGPAEPQHPDPEADEAGDDWVISAQPNKPSAAPERLYELRAESNSTINRTVSASHSSPPLGGPLERKASSANVTDDTSLGYSSLSAGQWEHPGSSSNNSASASPQQSREDETTGISEDRLNSSEHKSSTGNEAPPQYERVEGNEGPADDSDDETPQSITSPKGPGVGAVRSSAGPSHSRSSSHYEYHQDPTGAIEKLHVYDDSGLPVQDAEDDSWEPMATVGSYEIYDDKNNLLVEIEKENETTSNAAASGYTRVANNDDAASVTSLDDKTDFLFDGHRPTDDVDAAFQMATTKSMLTDEQRIAYCGVCRLGLAELGNVTRRYGPRARLALESLQMWGSKVILRLYNHLELNNDEQLMIESLAAHSLLAEDLTPCLKRVQHVSDGNIVQDKTVRGAQVNELHEEAFKPEQALEVDVRWTVMCDLFLIAIADGVYDSRSRTLLTLLGAKLGVSANEVAQFERKVTDVLQLDEPADQDWTEEDIIEARRRKALRRKYAYVGLATVGGGLVIGLSAGLLAPVVGAGLAAGLGTIGITGTSSFLAGAGGTAIIATASTAIGAHVGSRSMLRRVGHVKTFEFRPIFNNNRVNLVISVPGWMTGKDDDVRLPFSTIDPLMGDVFSVLWEPEMMRSLGQTINILATEALAQGVQQILAATVLTALLASLQVPMWLSKLSYLVDNPWSVSLDRAWAAGLILADTLLNRNLGSRPVTLVGYSLGSRVIYSCLTELARRNAFGLVQDVYLFGTPVFYNKKKFTTARSIVSGRFVNGYSNKDWILAFLFPARKRYGSVLGLDPVKEEAFNVENIDFSEEIDGHMSYRSKMPRLLSLCGWSVLSEEFDEIDDPDPEQLREKQRKLLHELEAADKPKKSGFFSSWKLDWLQRANAKQPDDKEGSDSGGLFDVDAIQSELRNMQPEMVFDAEVDGQPMADVPSAKTAEQLPLELIDVEPEPPEATLDYDDPESPKPLASSYRSRPAANTTSTSDKQPKLVFDDLE